MQKHMSTARIFVLGFLAVIVTGTLLLLLPWSTRSGESTSLRNAAFTAVSATCVTGLSLVDTYTYWSAFGQAVILFMIQIGGLGFMTVITLFSLLLRRRIGLREKQLLRQSSGGVSREETLVLMRRILFGTAIFEGVGAALLAIRFVPLLGLWRGIWHSVFHAVSAFCNAGFDLCGIFAPGQSLTRFAADPLICLTLLVLLTVGGIGYVVWDDICRNGVHVSRYSLHSKVVLTTNAVLLFGGAVLFYISERSGAFAKMDVPQAMLAALFQSGTTRTAGFFTVEQGTLSGFGRLLSCVLMFIGGSPGSTAGGVKTATVAVVVLNAIACIRGKTSACLFHRRFDSQQVRQASAILLLYLFGTIGAVGILTLYEPFSVGEIGFETISAMGTVGLSTGITAQLAPFSQCVLMLLMFIGRIGALTFLLAVAEQKHVVAAERPSEKILIG